MFLFIASAAFTSSEGAAVARRPVDVEQSQAGNSGGSASVRFTPLHTYFISPTGSDTNNGTSVSTAWATPNHNVLCGDVILVKPGTYSTQFHSFNHQPTGCPSTMAGIDGMGGIWAAAVVCAGNVGSCLVSSSVPGCQRLGGSCGNGNVNVGTSFWAVEGFQSTTNGSTKARSFVADGCAAILHHIAFINDMATNTAQGFTIADCGRSGKFGVDEWAVVGSVSQNSNFDPICLAAIDYVGPANSDSNAGTHTYIAGNFSFNNTVSCASDGQNYMVDSPDAHGYDGQIVLTSNIGYHASRMGLHIFASPPGAPTYYVNNNTLYGDQQTAVDGGGAQGDMSFFRKTVGTWPGTLSASNNIAQSTVAKQANNVRGAPVYALLIAGITNGSPGITIGTTGAENIFFGVSNQNVRNTDGSYTGTNFTVNPAFKNTADLIANHLGPPNCGSFPNVTACMGWNQSTGAVTALSVIDDLTPTAAQSIGKGYQVPQPCAPDPLYPTWLKGLVYLQASGFGNGAAITENEGLISKPCGM